MPDPRGPEAHPDQDELRGTRSVTGILADRLDACEDRLGRLEERVEAFDRWQEGVDLLFDDQQQTIDALCDLVKSERRNLDSGGGNASQVEDAGGGGEDEAPSSAFTRCDALSYDGRVRCAHPLPCPDHTQAPALSLRVYTAPDGTEWDVVAERKPRKGERYGVGGGVLTAWKDHDDPTDPPRPILRPHVPEGEPEGDEDQGGWDGPVILDLATALRERAGFDATGGTWDLLAAIAVRHLARRGLLHQPGEEPTSS